MTNPLSKEDIRENTLCNLVPHSVQRVSKRVIADELRKRWQTQADAKPQGQTALESSAAEIENGLKEARASSVEIGHFIKLIKKYKEPKGLTTAMACELIDRIVIHEAIGKMPNRQQQVDIYYNFIGQFDLPLSEKEIAEARQKAEREAAEKAKRKVERQRERNAAQQAKAKEERWAANDGHKYPKRVCEQWELYPDSTRQKYCTAECAKAHQQAEKGNHIFRQRLCKICGKSFWPSNGQEMLCSPACKQENRRQKQLAYYYRKQSSRETGSPSKTKETTQWKNSLQTSGQACAMSLSGTTI